MCVFLFALWCVCVCSLACHLWLTLAVVFVSVMFVVQSFVSLFFPVTAVCPIIKWNLVVLYESFPETTLSVAFVLVGPLSMLGNLRMGEGGEIAMNVTTRVT